MSLSSTLGVAVAQARSSLVAQSLGAKEPRRAARVGYRATVLMGTAGTGYIVAPGFLMGVFSRHPEVVAAGVTVLQPVARCSTPRPSCWAGR